ERSVRLIDAKMNLGGQRTWLFHESDVSPAALESLKPMISHSWDDATVHFPRTERKIDGQFHAIRSTEFSSSLKDMLGDDVLNLGVKANKITDHTVTLEDGTEFHGKCVLDARGAEELPPAETNGFRKHVGYDITLEAPHELTSPILMDATCPQLDGLRFFRLIPWDETKLLIEETFYSDSPDLNLDRISKSVRAYVERRGWKIKTIEKEERNVIPLPLTSESIRVSVTGEPIPIGARAGYLHATTGDALPDAMRFAELITKIPQNPKIPEFTTSTARDMLSRLRRPWISRQRFYRLINRLLFQASEPSLRYTIFQSFYALPEDTISRFTAGKTTWADRVRMLGGKSPVPLSVAMKHFSERSAAERAAVVKV
ncbi:MAG: lycopene beta-cyclase CrtY, partial [Bdellovibrionota bacterium]